MHFHSLHASKSVDQIDVHMHMRMHVSALNWHGIPMHSESFQSLPPNDTQTWAAAHPIRLISVQGVAARAAEILDLEWGMDDDMWRYPERLLQLMALRPKCCMNSQQEIARLCKMCSEETWYVAAPELEKSLARWRARAWREETVKPRTRAWYHRRVRGACIRCLACADFGAPHTHWSCRAIC